MNGVKFNAVTIAPQPRGGLRGVALELPQR